MRAFLRWIAKIIGSTLTILLVIVLFPFLSRLSSHLFPDESGAAIRASAILASKMENSARLETMRIQEDGVLNYDIRAAFIGTVGSVNISYKYEASFGIDLEKVTMQVAGNQIEFTLPKPELIHDSLTPNQVYQEDFWYKGFTFEDYENLLEKERSTRRNAYLHGDNKGLLWNASIAAFEKTIESWLGGNSGNLSFHYVEATDVVDN